VGEHVVEFILGRYALLFYSTIAFIITTIAAFEYAAMVPVAIVLALVSALGWHDYSQ